jgi:adenosylmethionine-8-amino-7-oxononanoate aminotransferase
MAAGGMMIYPKEYLENAARLARQYDVHLIVDEVATGFGRTGKMFACDHARTRPDFLCLSKGITSGTLPLAATLTTDVIYKAFYCDYREKKTFYHGHTYTANPIAVAAAAASLKVFEEEGTLDRIRDLAPLLQEGIDDLKSLRLVGDTRHLGMIGALELVKDRASKRVFSFEERIGAGIYKDALEEHLILRPLGNIIYLFLPLCTTRKELIYILERTRLVVKRAEKRLLG